MPRKHTPRRPKDDSHFTWQEDDVTFVFPQQPTTVLSEELHTILWSLEHVGNKTGLSDVMPNVAAYLTDHPQDQSLVEEALKRVEQRVEHAT